MVVYIRLEPHEVKDSRKKIIDVKDNIARIQENFLRFNNIRNERKVKSMGIITRTKTLESEIAHLKNILPKIEAVKAKERILWMKEKEMKKVKTTFVKEKSAKRAKEKTKKKTKYQEELEELRKKIEELK